MRCNNLIRFVTEAPSQTDIPDGLCAWTHSSVYLIRELLGILVGGLLPFQMALTGLIDRVVCQLQLPTVFNPRHATSARPSCILAVTVQAAPEPLDLDWITAIY